jgi:putative two-component system response regulator
VAAEVTDRVTVEERLRHSYRETIQRLARAVEFRDNDTGDHVERMSGLCLMIAQGLGLDEDHCDRLREASVMHDAGKIAIPDSILLKPGPLTTEERRQMETHTTIGHDLLAGSTSPLLDLAAIIALTHHERYDGTGYPQGLAGPDIPVEGRIVAVADVYDALTSDRVYRPAMPVSEALAILEAGRGTHFDPLVLDAFLAGLPGIVALGGGAAPAAEVPMPRLALAGAGVA